MRRPTNETDYLGLPAEERIMLIRKLVDSLIIESPASLLTPEETAELDRRCEALDSGEDPGVSWEAVKRELMERR